MGVTVIIDKRAYPSEVDNFEDGGENVFSYVVSNTMLRVLRLNIQGLGKPRLECTYPIRNIVSVSGSQYVFQHDKLKDIEFTA